MNPLRNALLFASLLVLPLLAVADSTDLSVDSIRSMSRAEFSKLIWEYRDNKDRLREIRSLLADAKTQAEDGEMASDFAAELGRLEAKRELYKVLSSGALAAAKEDITNHLKTNNEGGVVAQAYEYSAEVAPIKVAVEPRNAGVDGVDLKVSVDDELMKELLEEHKDTDLGKAFAKLSAGERRKIVEDILTEIKEKSQIKESLTADDINSEELDLFEAELGVVVAHLEERVGKIGTAEDSLSEIATAHDKQSEAKEKDLELTEDASEKMDLLEDLGVELRDGTAAKYADHCAFLASKVAWSNLSYSEKEACEGAYSEEARKVADKEEESEGDEASETRSLAAGDSDDQEAEDEERKPTAEEIAAQQAAQAQQQLAQRRQAEIDGILTQLRLSCDQDALNESLQIQNAGSEGLDELADSFSIDLSACTSTASIDTEGSFYVGDGVMVAEEALSDLYPGGAQYMSDADAVKLPKEVGCLERGMKRSLSKIERAKEIALRDSWKLASAALVNMLKTNPSLISTTQAMMVQQGDLRNPVDVLREEIRGKIVDNLEKQYQVSEWQKRHDIFRTMWIGVKDVMTARQGIIQNTNIRASTQQVIAPAVSKGTSTTQPKIAPSRDVSGSAGRLR